MLDSAQLAALAACHRRGSFDLAAADLHVTPSAISQRIKALEEVVGTLLLVRSQPCTATPTGLRLIRHLAEISLLDHALAADLPTRAPAAATLRIAVNADSLATWVITALAATQGYLFDLVIDDQDISQDRLKRGDVVAAITSHPGPLQGCDTLALGAMRYHATASPGYLARWLPMGATASALARAPALTFSDHDRLQHLWVARHIPTAEPRENFPSHRIATSQGFVDACRAGLGWGMNPAALIAADLASGALVELLPGATLDVALHWQFSRLTAAAIAPLTVAIQQAAKDQLI